MLYKRNSEQQLSDELFKNPTCEYRGTPFWAWNTKMDHDTVLSQIEMFKEMGLGGFHMHPRTGFANPYLSEEFFDLVKDCTNIAKERSMLAWLYDEDRFASGSAGGIVTKERKYRKRFLKFTPNPQNENFDFDVAVEKGLTHLIAVYDIVIDDNGFLSSYDKVDINAEVKGTKWYAYMCTSEDDTWFNGQAYIDTLSKKAIDKFIEVTHENYYKNVGDEFGETIPAIFTDEPQFERKQVLNFPTDKKTVVLPWTYDLPESFAAQYGYSITDRIPELFWDLPNNKISLARYHYHDHVSQRFTEAFADNYGEWCEAHGIAMTGHMMEEPSLTSQTASLGEAMRSYRKFTLPGIDMLINNLELSTAKQAQSAVHQYGREGMLSELYGVTDWDFDFRGHKYQGDWQAALGVTIRVHHLFFASMKGEAKRDYPASIGYQSPWYTQYSVIEDHFARVNTAMTRGKPVVKIGVIHPVESYWLHWGPSFTTDGIRAQKEENFNNIINWLLRGMSDFDFISESLFPDQVKEIKGNKLPVGVMEYDTIIVPALETIRSSTVKILKEFKEKGGRVIFVGDVPEYVDAVPSADVAEFADKCEKIPYNKNSIIEALESDRVVGIRNSNGTMTSNLIYQMRQDNDCYWLFIAHVDQNKNIYISKPQDVEICIKGEYTPYLYDSMSGEIKNIDFRVSNGKTYIKKTLFSEDSLLLKLAEPKVKEFTSDKIKLHQIGYEVFKEKVSYKTTEPNVLLLDTAEYKLDDMTEFFPENEILMLDNHARKLLGLPNRDGHIIQPWVQPPQKPTNTLTLKFRINSEITVKNPILALEDAEQTQIIFNDEPVESKILGYFTDKAIKTVALPEIKAGENTLILNVPIGKDTHTEWCYILGDFGVRVEGAVKTIVPAADKIAFTSVTKQGLPFYGANIVYETEFTAPEDCTVVLKNGAFKGAMVAVSVDGNFVGNILFEPYTLTIPDVKKGVHTLQLTLYGNRFNCFGALHNSNSENKWIGPGIWRLAGIGRMNLGDVEYDGSTDIYYSGDCWTDEYNLRDLGILTSPAIFYMK